MSVRTGVKVLEPYGCLSASLVGAVTLGLCLVSTFAKAEIRIVGASDADWTVLTIAPDGSWGASTESYLHRAIANAIQRCQKKSGSALGCGAYHVSVQGGWASGLRCGRENILGVGTTRADALQSAAQRELRVRQLFRPDMESCRQLVIVAPDGSFEVPPPQAIASGSRRKR